jgi:cardiolipin synthase A/B
MEQVFAGSTVLRWLALISLLLVLGYFLLALFAPHLPYKVDPPQAALESREYAHMLQSVADAPLMQGNKVRVLPNGENYFPAELEAIRAATHSVNLEAYIFSKGKMADQFIAVLADRARNGVKVKLLLDAMGSATTTRDYLKPILDAGGQVEFYHALKWYSWDRINNRTHRELIVIDGKKAFIGGSGIADHWMYEQDGKKRWRDTMVEVEGPVVSDIQGAFVENWVEASGELIVGTDYYPIEPTAGNVPAMIISSSAGVGRSTRARMLFQTLIASSQTSVYINTPYFLPDKSIREELARAAKRGVDVRIITPGVHSDHALTRSSSRRLYGDILQAGAKVYEYQPAMIHAKTLLVDGKWSVIGSTNVDNRSFELNDEVNMAAFDGEMTGGLTRDFMNDLKESQQITYEQWKNRPLWERGMELLGRIIERQQ